MVIAQSISNRSTKLVKSGTRFILEAAYGSTNRVVCTDAGSNREEAIKYFLFVCGNQS